MQASRSTLVVLGRLGLLAFVQLALLAGPVTRAQAGPGLLVGAAEDAAKADPATATVQMRLARSAGLSVVRLTTLWQAGETTPAPAELGRLENAAAAASEQAIRLFLSVYPASPFAAPTTPAARATFAQFCASLARLLPSVRDFIVGNEPNLNGFWMPQFAADGGELAAVAYEALLAQVYDSLKAVSPSISVLGGALASRGQDNPFARRQTQSPTAFIAALGRAYRASGRRRPLMDALAFHPYEDNSSLPPSFAHPHSTTISLADYGKLVAALGRAFDGTGQPGSRLPIVYDEFGVETRIPIPEASHYWGREPPTTAPVDEQTQAAFYAQAIALAACQPNVVALLLLHVSDETNLAGWQSGLFYADDTPKQSLAPVEQAIGDLRLQPPPCA